MVIPSHLYVTLLHGRYVRSEARSRGLRYQKRDGQITPRAVSNSLRREGMAIATSLAMLVYSRVDADGGLREVRIAGRAGSSSVSA